MGELKKTQYFQPELAQPPLSLIDLVGTSNRSSPWGFRKNANLTNLPEISFHAWKQAFVGITKMVIVTQKVKNVRVCYFYKPPIAAERQRTDQV